MRTTLSQIEAFYWITRLGSFRAAATQLNLTQPTISLRIRNLEESLGGRLFRRAGRGMRLTDKGATLLPDVRRMMDVAGDLAQKRGLDDPLHGRLRLGTPTSVALGCIAELYAALGRRSPSLEVDLTVDRSIVLQKRLNEREIDLAIVVEPQIGPHVRAVPLGMMKHAWAASPRLGLRRRWIGPADLVAHKVLTQPDPSNLMMLVLTWFGSAGLEPRRMITCDNLSVLVRLTVAGEGVSVLAPSVIESELRDGRLQLLRTRPVLVRPRLYLAYQVDKAGRDMSLAIEAVRAVIAQSRLLVSR